MTLASIAGIAIALFVVLLAYFVRLDRDRAFYPTLLMVIASYHVLFATMAARRTRSFSNIAGHGVFDFFHASIIANPGVPVWWPAFCFTFDLSAAAWLAFVTASHRR